MIYHDGIIDAMQFDTGFRFKFARVDAEMNYDRWYNNDVNGLLPVATIDNGLSLFQRQDLIKYNLFRIFSTILKDAASSDVPRTVSDDFQTQVWLDENFEMVWRRVDRGAEYWARKDRAIWVVFKPDPEIEGALPSLAAIDPSEYFRIGLPEDEDELVGHVIAQRWRERTEAELQDPSVQLTDNRITVYYYVPAQGINMMRTYELAGDTIKGLLYEDEDDPILTLCTVGRGDSWYGDAETLVARAMIMITNGDVDLNRYNNPILGIPAGAFAAPRSTRPDGKTEAERVKDLQNTVRPVIALPEGIVGADLMATARAEPAFEARHWQFDNIVTAVARIAGVPPQVEGQDIGRTQSGAAIERMQYQADAKVRYFRNGVIACIIQMCVALGCPTPDFSVQYFTSAFQTVQARTEELLKLHAAGIFTTDEVRAEYGKDPLPASQSTESPNPSNDDNTDGG